MSKKNGEVNQNAVITTDPFPASSKVHVSGAGSHGVQVAMREISHGNTGANGHGGNGNSVNGSAVERPRLRVYDTSGPYTDPAAQPDVRQGLQPLRLDWIAARGDTVETESHYRANQRCGRKPFSRHGAKERVAGQTRRQREPDALRAPGHGHAGDGIHRRPREHRPRSRAQRRRRRPPCRQQFRRVDPAVRHPGVRAGRGSQGTGHHPLQHQPSRNRAHDHRPELPGEDQRQHRQLGRHLLHRGRGGEDDLGHALGRGHGHGSVHRRQHPRNP